jgi:hypothetical protein
VKGRDSGQLSWPLTLTALLRAKVEGRELPKARKSENQRELGEGASRVRPSKASALALCFGRQFTPNLKTVKQFFVRLSFKFNKRTLLPEPGSIFLIFLPRRTDRTRFIEENPLFVPHWLGATANVRPLLKLAIRASFALPRVGEDGRKD